MSNKMSDVYWWINEIDVKGPITMLNLNLLQIQRKRNLASQLKSAVFFFTADEIPKFFWCPLSSFASTRQTRAYESTELNERLEL